MADDTLRFEDLVAGLDGPDDAARWRALAERALKGAPLSRLDGRSPEGLVVRPLYRAGDAGTEPADPLARGLADVGPPEAPWTIHDLHTHAASPEGLNTAILEGLEAGAMGVTLRIDPAGQDGLALMSAPEMATALSDVWLDVAPVALDAGPWGLEAARALGDALALARVEAAARAGFDLDPFASAFAGQGFSFTLGEAASAAMGLAQRCPMASLLRADGVAVHEAGADGALEIGTALAAATDLLRAAQGLGVAGAMATLAPRIVFHMALGPEVLPGIAKLRALRAGWARVTTAVLGEALPARIHAITGARMMSRADPWVNPLRTTAAAFAAVAGGARSLAVRPLTDALGLPTAQGMRLARNTQLVLMEECRLGHVVDPAGGAWAFEAATDGLARAGWSAFQTIEGEGGLAASLVSGGLAERVERAREALQAAVATRRHALVGVSEYPLPGETLPAFLPFPEGRRQPAGPFAPMRLSAPFEALRTEGEARGLVAFTATVGPLSDFAARAGFARNLLAAGGVRLTGDAEVHADNAACARAFSASGARVAIVCGSDEGYAGHAAGLAQALKAAGARRVLLAGRPGEHEAGWRAAGVDAFVFAGGNALDALRDVHAAA